jgi:hypothetical protein
MTNQLDHTEQVHKLSDSGLFVYQAFFILASRLFHNRINIKRLYSPSSSTLFCVARAPGCRLLLPDDAEGPRTYLHIYYSDGSWGPPHASGQTYALVRHWFAYALHHCKLYTRGTQVSFSSTWRLS